MAYNTVQTPLASMTRTATVSVPTLRVRTRTVSAQRSTLNAVNAGDLPVYVSSKAIAGTIYTAGGVVAANAVVKLVRQADDKVVAQAITDSFGHYIFTRDSADSLAYYVISYTSATNPQVHGVSDRGLVPV